MTLAYPISLPITLLVLVLAGATALAHFRPSAKLMWPSVFLLVIALGLTGRFATWNAVLDDQGIRINAPLGLFHTSGAMTWSDVNSLSLRRHGQRGGSPSLYISGMTGRLSLPIGDMNPDEAERLVAEIQRRASLPDERGGGEWMRRRVRLVGVDGFKPAMLRLREGGEQGP